MKDIVAKTRKPFDLFGLVSFYPVLVGARAKCVSRWCQAEHGQWRPFYEFGFRMMMANLSHYPKCKNCRFGKCGSGNVVAHSRSVGAMKQTLDVQGSVLGINFPAVQVWCGGCKRWTDKFKMEVLVAEARQIDLLDDAVIVTVRNLEQCNRCHEREMRHA